MLQFLRQSTTIMLKREDLHLDQSWFVNDSCSAYAYLTKLKARYRVCQSFWRKEKLQRKEFKNHPSASLIAVCTAWRMIKTPQRELFPSLPSLRSGRKKATENTKICAQHIDAPPGGLMWRLLIRQTGVLKWGSGVEGGGYWLGESNSCETVMSLWYSTLLQIIGLVKKEISFCVYNIILNWMSGNSHIRTKVADNNFQQQQVEHCSLFNCECRLKFNFYIQKNLWVRSLADFPV